MTNEVYIIENNCGDPIFVNYFIPTFKTVESAKQFAREMGDRYGRYYAIVTYRFIDGEERTYQEIDKATKGLIEDD